MNLKEALSLIDDLEGSFKGSKTSNITKTAEFPKLYIMESFQPFAQGYALWIKKLPRDKTASKSMHSLIKSKGLNLTFLCERYWIIYTSKF